MESSYIVGFGKSAFSKCARTPNYITTAQARAQETQKQIYVSVLHTFWLKEKVTVI